MVVDRLDSDPLAAVAQQLYALPPAGFIAARDCAAAEAKTSGDRELAGRITALRKPTVGAWLVNLLAYERPDQLGELFALGDQLRAAQRALRGDELRELSARRRASVAELSREAGVLGRQAGVRANLPLAEVEATLTAALADPGVAEEVRAARLTRTVEYTGFGEAPRPKLRLLQGGTPPAGGRELSQSGPPDAEVDTAREAQDRLAAEAERRAARVRRRQERSELDRELHSARTGLVDAQAARALADRAVAAAQGRLEKATEALAEFEGDLGRLVPPEG